MINTVKKWVNYEGRNKYKYAGSSLKYDSVVNIQGSTTGGGAVNKPDDKDNVYPWQLYLSKASNVFDKVELQIDDITDTSYVIGYVSTDRMPVFVSDLSKSESENKELIGYKKDADGNLVYDENGEPIPIYKDNWGIQGLVDGVSVQVVGNGSTNTYLKITVSADAPEEGTLKIPCNLLRSRENVDFDMTQFDMWEAYKGYCASVWLEYHWTIDASTSSQSNWQLDLTNQTAFINWDEETNKPVNGAVEPECTAILYYGGVFASAATKEDITYSLADFPSSQAVPANAVTINPETGVIDFDMKRLSFNGSALSIKVVVYVGGERLKGVEKIMTIYKNLPKDGQPAVTQWIVTTPDQVLFNPNEVDTNGSINPEKALSHQKIQAQVWKQVGGDVPVKGDATIYFGWNTDNPTNASSTAGYAEVAVDVSDMIDAAGKPQSKWAVFALKNEDGDIYEMEEVIVVAQGKNGTNGNDGKDSTVPGPEGKSVYTLYLTNDSASVNCDKDGNVYATSKALLECDATLYYGKDKVVTKSVTDIIWTVQTNAGTNIPFDISDNGATISLDFSQYTFPQEVKGIKVNITSEYSGETFSKIMSISKNYPGADGTSPTNYWLVIFPNVITCTKAKTQTGAITYQPDASVVTVTAKKQVGDGAIWALSPNEGEIIWNWHYRSGGIDDGGSDTSGSTTINITGEDCVKYGSINVYLKIGNEIVDDQMVPILANGLDGEDGKQGRTGAAVRGPVEWIDDEMGNRVFCDGNEYTGTNQTIKNAHPELWIDIVHRRENDTDKYYRCIDSFQCDPTDTWNDVKDYFEQADAQYKFVATDLLLAKDASIDFLTGNEIYLRNGDNVITAGAAGGDGINFWAGSDKPGEAPFQVNNDGEVTATKGTFGPWELSKNNGLVATGRDGAVLSSFDLQHMKLYQGANGRTSSVDINVALPGAPVKINNSAGYASIETNKPLLQANRFVIDNANPDIESNYDYNLPTGVLHIITLTKAQYTTMESYGTIDNNTLYIITDDID